MMKTLIVRGLVLMVAYIGVGISPMGSCAQDLCSCGPDYCLNDPRFPPLLAEKKKALRTARFSEDLIALLEQDGQCVAAVSTGPDTFFIKRKIGAAWDTSELNAEREQYARADLMSGATAAYYKFNTNHALACCGQPKFDKRPDWDSALDLNLSLAITCRKSGGAVICQRAK